MPPTPPCPTRAEVEAYYAGTLDEAGEARVGSHEGCPACAPVFDAVRAANSPKTAAAPPGPPGGVAPAAPPDVPGYSQLRLIATMGMGELYAGWDDVVGRPVAVKVLRAALYGLPNREEFVARFAGECDRMADCQRTHIPDIYTRGALAADGRPYLVMPWIGGGSLRQQVDGARPRPLLDAHDLGVKIEWFTQICGAVAYAHERLVVHLDIKPDNILIGDGDDAYLIDWGLSRFYTPRLLQRPRGGRPTGRPRPASEPDRLLGTPGYMSPEQASETAALLGPRMDVFALGSLLVYLLTGEPAYRTEAHRAAELAATRAKLRRLGSHQELADVAVDCLADDPESRPEDGAGVVARLRVVQDAARRRAQDAEIRRVQAAEEAKAVRARLDLLTAKRRARAWIAAVGAIALVGLGMAAVMFSASAWAWDADPSASGVNDFMTAASQAEAESGTGAERIPDHREEAEKHLTEALEKYQAISKRLYEPRAPGEGLQDKLYAQFVRVVGRGTEAGRVAADAEKKSAALRDRVDRIKSTRDVFDAADRARIRVWFNRSRMTVARLHTISRQEVEDADRLFSDVFRRVNLHPHADDFAGRAGRVGEEQPAMKPALVAALDGWALCSGPADPGGPPALTPRAREFLRAADRLDEDATRKEVRRAVLAGRAALNRWWEDRQKGDPLARPPLSPEAILLLAGGLTFYGEQRVASKALSQYAGDPPPLALSDQIGLYWVGLALAAHLAAHVPPDSPDQKAVYPAVERASRFGPRFREVGDGSLSGVMFETAEVWKADGAIHSGAKEDAWKALKAAYRPTDETAVGSPLKAAINAVRTHPQTDYLIELGIIILWDRNDLSGALTYAGEWAEKLPSAITPRAYEVALRVHAGPAGWMRAAAWAWFQDAKSRPDADPGDVSRAQLVLASVGAVEYPAVPAGVDPRLAPGAGLPAVLFYQHLFSQDRALFATAPEPTPPPPLPEWLRPTDGTPREAGAGGAGTPAARQSDLPLPMTWSVSRRAARLRGLIARKDLVQAKKECQPLEELFDKASQLALRRLRLECCYRLAAMNPGEAGSMREEIDQLAAGGVDTSRFRRLIDQHRMVLEMHPDPAPGAPGAPGAATSLGLMAKRMKAAADLKDGDWLAVHFAVELCGDQEFPLDPWEVGAHPRELPPDELLTCVLTGVCGHASCKETWLDPKPRDRLTKKLLHHVERSLKDQALAPADMLRRNPALGAVYLRLKEKDAAVIDALGGPQQARRWKELLAELYHDP